MPAVIIPLPKGSDESALGQPKLKPREQTKVLLEEALATGIRGALRDAVKAALDIAVAPVKRDLTELQYDTLKPGGKLVDPTRPGFLARATRRGTRFIYRFAHPETGKQTEHALGYLGDITLAEARQTWEQLRAQRMAGKVPALVEDDEAPRKDVPTLEKLCRLYLDEYASQVKRSWKDDERLLNRHIVPVYGDWPADRFDADEAQRLLDSLDGTPRERDKLKAALSVMFNLGLKGGNKKKRLAERWLPADMTNPMARTVTTEHKAVIHKPELSEARAYFHALNSNSAGLRQDHRDALLLQLLTASRIGEIVGMRWGELSIEQGKFTLPAARSKNKEEHVVFFSAPALELLERRKEWAAPKDVFVFPAVMAPQTNHLRPDLVSNALAKHRHQLGVGEKFTSHGARHMFATWAGEQNVPVKTVDRCMAHSLADGINAVYNAAKLNGQAKALWARWADWLNE